MTNRNGSKGSGNQGSPKSGQFQQEFSAEFETGNDNKKEKNIVRKREVNQKGVNHFTPFDLRCGRLICIIFFF